MELSHKCYEECYRKLILCGLHFFFMKGLTSLEFNDHVMGCGFFRGHFLSCLGHTGAACRRGTHLGQNLVQPLQGTIQMQLDPARSACDSLPPGKEDIHFNV